jgi:hypothetical protein
VAAPMFVSRSAALTMVDRDAELVMQARTVGAPQLRDRSATVEMVARTAGAPTIRERSAAHIINTRPATVESGHGEPGDLTIACEE